QLDVLVRFSGAEDEAERTVLIRPALVAVEPAKIELHLSFVGSPKMTELQLERDEASHAAVIEEEVEIIVFAVDCDPMLACDEGEVSPELEEKALQLAEDRGLQIFFAEFSFEPEEIEHVGVAEHEIGR